MIRSAVLLFRAFYEPDKVFAEIAQKAAIGPLVIVLIALSLVSIAAQVVIMSKMDQEALMRAQLEEQNMSEEQIERAVEIGRIAMWVAPVATVVIVPIAMAILAAIYFLAMKLVGSNADYMKTFSGIVHAYWPPSAAAGLAMIAIALTKREIDPEKADRLVKSNIGALLPDDANAALRAFLGFFDVFTIWTIVLAILAVSIIGGLTRKNAVFVVLSLWTIWLVVKVAAAAVFAMMGA